MLQEAVEAMNIPQVVPLQAQVEAVWVATADKDSVTPEKMARLPQVSVVGAVAEVHLVVLAVLAPAALRLLDTVVHH
jgi:hypothetical protein